MNLYVKAFEGYRPTGRQTDRPTDRQTIGHTDTQTESIEIMNHVASLVVN